MPPKKEGKCFRFLKGFLQQEAEREEEENPLSRSFIGTEWTLSSTIFQPLPLEDKWYRPTTEQKTSTMTSTQESFETAQSEQDPIEPNMTEGEPIGIDRLKIPLVGNLNPNTE